MTLDLELKSISIRESIRALKHKHGYYIRIEV